MKKCDYNVVGTSYGAMQFPFVTNLLDLQNQSSMALELGESITLISRAIVISEGHNSRKKGTTWRSKFYRFPPRRQDYWPRMGSGELCTT